MTARGHPWLVSAAIHIVLAAAAASWLRFPQEPSAVRMHFSSSGTTQGSSIPVTVPGSPAAKPAAPGLPSWKGRTAEVPPHAPAAPVSLDELLGEPSRSEESRSAASGWESEGYSPPPLPPPGLAPPQGARWTLVISVPAGGGPGVIEGLDSGHPELDGWLENYLRTVSFPAGIDGAYQLRWSLRLVSDRPR